MKFRPAIIVIIICAVGIAVSATTYFISQNRAAEVFAGDLEINSLQRKVESGQALLVYFYGRSCEDCVASEPYLVEALVAAPQITAYKCEREANATVRGLYGVEATPTLIYFNQGAESARQEGSLLSAQEYAAWIKEVSDAF